MRTSGIDDLVTTLVKQHGLELAMDLANHQRRAIRGVVRGDIWGITYRRLRLMREAQRAH